MARQLQSSVILSYMIQHADIYALYTVVLTVYIPIHKINQYRVSSISLSAATGGRHLLKSHVRTYSVMCLCLGLMVCVHVCLLYCGFGWFHRAAPYGESLLMHVNESTSSVWKKCFKPALTWRQVACSLNPIRPYLTSQCLIGFKMSNIFNSDKHTQTFVDVKAWEPVPGCC